MEKISYLNQPNCYRLSNETVEAVVTTDIGPRVIRYAFRDGENILGEVPDASIETPLGEWKPWGGHRLWAAPEASPRSYVPDNTPVEFAAQGERAIVLRQPTESPTGIQKELSITLADEGSGVRVVHRITNRNLWSITLAPWALTIMQGGGEAIFPQEPFRSWDECLTPARPLVLWHYTDLSDPRWTIGPKFIRLRTDDALAAPQKIGIANKQGWAAYLRGGTLYVKRFGYLEGASYPDYGSNAETYTAGSFIEIESLAPLRQLEPDESVEHEERWYLFRDILPADASESALDEMLRPVLSQTR
ncbi:MAG TPA: hypothetical protein VNA19_11040 [Pyrinomonadaceae bacterium]|nr:hypothetical protein [Pyrinomonadaceae bacterium]